MDKAIRHIPTGFDQIGAKPAGAKMPRVCKVVSLFSGCGGMDLGFVGGFGFMGKFYNRLPFEIVWANDLDETACATYEQNLGHKPHCGDVSGLLDTLPRRADVLMGGFPCQDVSINGSKAANNGERSTLYRVMQEAIRRTNPRIFIAENVKGILMEHSKALYSEMMRGFESLGYDVRQQVYLAADYEVPQMRERVLFVGTRKGSRRRFEHPGPILDSMRWWTAGEALADLEKAGEDASIAHIWSKAKRSPEQGRRQLKADRPGTTIRAECHGNQQFHYILPRRISLREAARLQSFPDDFAFVGGMRKIERQIGNAVPPVLAWHVAKAVRDYLK